MTSMEDIIFPVHPAFQDRTVMKKDVMSWSVIAGIPPRLMEQFVRGRMIPDDMVRQRIEQALGEELTTDIIENCDPLRGMEFRNKAIASHYSVHADYPVTLLKAGDMIRCDDQRWLRLSGVESPERGRVLIHSGEVPVSWLSVNDHVIAAVNNTEGKDSNPLKPSTRRRLSKAMSRELFSGMELSAERADTSEKIIGIMEGIRDGD